MVTSDLIAYINNQLKNGISPDNIQRSLLSQGNLEVDIQTVFNQLNNQNTIPPNGNTNLYPVIAFLKVENPSRFYAIPFLGGLIKLIILIPIFIEMFFLSLFLGSISPINAIIVLFTGKCWQVYYKYVLGFVRFSCKINFFLYGLTNKYPGFGFSIDDTYSVNIPYPVSSSRLYAFPVLGLFIRSILMLPISLYCIILQYGVTVGAVIASLFVLITGKYPESIFELVRDTTRVSMGIYCYSFGLSDKYPSFHISFNHKVIKLLLIFSGLLFIVSSFAYSYTHPSSSPFAYPSQLNLYKNLPNGNTGDACSLNSECKSKHCVDDTCTTGNVGDPCFISVDCQSGLTCTSSFCQLTSSSSNLAPVPTKNSDIKPSPSSTPISNLTETSIFTKGISTTIISEVPYFVITGTFNILAPNSFSVQTVDLDNAPQTLIILYDSSLIFKDKNSGPLDPTQFVTGDNVKILANTKRGQDYQANSVQNLTR